THKPPSLSGTLQEVDLVTVLRASQTISEEIVLSNLLKEIMQIVIQNAGAQKGYLILEKNDSLFIEAEGHINKKDIKVLQSIPMESSSDLSAGIVNYVRRTMEIVVLKNAAEEGLFVSDPYVTENHPKSILCIPILKQKKLNGILYLENNLLTDAFTKERLEVLSLLAVQASISLENAKLYEDVEQRVIQLQMADEEQRRLYSQLIQSQKMEAVGRLAGGVAHDFNNILTTIIGYCELTNNRLSENDPLRENIETIWAAADKAAALTRQLLTFSRKQLIEMKVVNLNEIIKNMGKMLIRLIGEDIGVDLKINRPVGNIPADPGQLEQILMNLAVNARDAMPFGGRFTVETKDVYLDENFTRNHEEVVIGNYVMLKVSDTGEGISPELQEKIFEPFFTTKEKEKGTGLGLSTVFGIVKQHNAHIFVNSEKDRGTTFKIYFPVVDESISEAEQSDKEKIPHGSETILIVEDETTVRQLISETLKNLGYNLLEAGSGDEALGLINNCAQDIHLILTDMILPGMKGPELIKTIKPKLPDAKVIYMSGYTEDIIKSENYSKEGVIYLQKPLMPSILARKLREVLDDPGKGVAA
ncbi:MAG: response regulator, partial [Deltaproteobacteria bacterium]|nr:response regulator [Deltaproteobacteria bacterium]